MESFCTFHSYLKKIDYICNVIFVYMKQKATPLNCPLEEYEGWIAMKEYWDDYSHEWSYSTLEEKLIRLAGFVKLGGDLNTVLNDYAEGRDESYRCRIQCCVFSYIERLISGDLFECGAPIIDRIKRLDKEELVRLLTEELLRSVKEIKEYDNNYKLVSYWKITDEFVNNDANLDAIEREHWRKFPDESFSYYSDKSNRWEKGPKYSLW